MNLKIRHFILSLFFITGSAVAHAERQQIGTSTTYWEIVDGTLTISGTGEMPNYNYQTEKERPWYSERESITEVVIAEGITKTGGYAFDAFPNLATIVLPGTLKELATSSFSNCSLLDNVIIPDNVETIGYTCFAQCSNLKNVVISEGVKTLGTAAFTNCHSLVTITIPSTVTSIVSNTFTYTGSMTDFVVNEGNTAYCSEDGVLFTKDKTLLVRYPQNNARTSYEVPEGVVTIGSSAFSSDRNLTALTLSNSVKTIESSAFYATSKIATLTLSENLESIGAYAFYKLKVTSLTLPESITNIGVQAFYDSKELKTVIVNWATPGDVTYGADIFKGVTVSDVKLIMPEGTEELYAAIDTWKDFKTGETRQQIGESEVYWEIVDGVLVITGTGDIPDFMNAKAQPWASERASITGIEIGEGITRIGKYSFTDCDQLTTILFPGTVASIGEFAFSGCKALPSLTIPESVKTVDFAAFQNCAALTDLTISEGVVGIGRAAFYGCEGLTAIHIPASVKSIANSVFSIDALTDIAVAEGNTVYSSLDGVLYNKELTALLQYPRGKTDTSYSIPEGVVLIGDSAFIDGNKSLTEIILPSTLQEIRSVAFYGCNALTSIDLPESLTAIGDYAFGYCTGLTEIIAHSSTPGDLTYGYGVFGGVTIEGVTLYVPRATGDLYGAIDTWSSFTLEELPERIGESDIYWDIVDGVLLLTGTGDMPDFMNERAQPWASERASITGVEIAEGITRIGNYAFTDCDQLASILFSNTVESIGNFGFSGCTALSSVVIPGNIATIDFAAFLDCTGLTDLTISEGVVGIGRAVFSGCEGLTTIHIPASVKSIANSVFSIDALTDITVAEGNTVYSSLDGVLYNKDLTALLQYPRGKTDADYTIPEGVVLIGDTAFINGNKNLTEIILPSTLQEIRYAAFYGCNALTSIDLPESLITMGDYAFSYCKGLTEVTVNWSDPELVTYGSGVFSGVTVTDVKLYTPGATKDFYEAIDTWKDFDIQGIYSGLNDISTQSNGMNVFTTEGGVLIESAKAGKVLIYTVDGLLVKEVRITEGNNTVALPFGPYLVNGKLILVK